MKPVSKPLEPAVSSAAAPPIALVSPMPPPIALDHPAAEAAEAAPAPDEAPPPSPGAAFTGGALRQAREARGLTLQQLSDRTRITRHHLENVEADRYERLPATVYLRGILTSVAKELRLDAGEVARSYLAACAASGVVGNGR